jgi:hypothetical protein
MKKLFGTLALGLTLALTSATALAAPQVAFKRAPQHERNVVLDAERVMMRSGTVTLDVDRGARRADLSLLSSDARIDIKRVMVTYAGGRTVMLRGNRFGNDIDLPDGGRIVSVKVQYLNRGARGGMIKLIAKDARPHRPGFQQR